MKRIDKIEYLINNNGVTFLGAGPMSKNSVDAVIDLAQEYDLPIGLIPSRRQVECASLGGGYVGKWTTETFSEYVRYRDKKNNVILCRDHSGPWQLEKRDADGKVPPLNIEMESLLVSLRADIKSEFDLIHVDASLGLRNGLNKEEIRAITCEIVGFCESVSKGSVHYEIGTEEQVFGSSQINLAEEELGEVFLNLKKLKLPKPKFFVQQTGTKVNELKNVGNYDNPLDSKGMLPASFQITKILNICRQNNIWLKEHNADYLSNQALEWHNRFGIHGANIAPEFGTQETRTFVNLANQIGATDLVLKLNEMVLAGNKWEKWMLQDSNATAEDKTLIAGHYHFSDEWFIEIYDELKQRLKRESIDLETELYFSVKKAIERVLIYFGYNHG
jgi:hypothetical protein